MHSRYLFRLSALLKNSVILASSLAGVGIAESNDDDDGGDNGDERVPESHLGVFVFLFFFANGYFFSF